jgi:hypothetical protein
MSKACVINIYYVHVQINGEFGEITVFHNNFVKSYTSKASTKLHYRFIVISSNSPYFQTCTNLAMSNNIWCVPNKSIFIES